jgi:hypothetical protein
MRAIVSKKSVAALPYSMCAIMDPRVGRIPDVLSAERIGTTDSCVVVGTLMMQDGLTRFEIDFKGPPDAIHEVRLSFSIQTPNQYIAICDVTGKVHCDARVDGVQSSIRIWTNHVTEPDSIWVEIMQ